MSRIVLSLCLLLVSLKLLEADPSNAVLQFPKQFVEQIVSPAQSGYSSLKKEISDWTSAKSMLKALREQNASLREERLVIEELQNENLRLRQIINFQQEQQFDGVAAEVIGRRASTFVDALVLNKGSADGVQEEMAVVDGEVIVGQVVSVRKNSSIVLLVTDRTSAVDVRLQGSRASGVAEGGVDGRMSISYLQNTNNVYPGERVLTSGLDGVFPKGLEVGLVSSVSRKGGELFYRIQLKPSVEVSKLETVLILAKK